MHPWRQEIIRPPAEEAETPVIEAKFSRKKRYIRMTTISAESVKNLREKTGAGMMECKKHWQKVTRFEKAIDLLRPERTCYGSQESRRTASEGLIESYIHMGRSVRW